MQGQRGLALIARARSEVVAFNEFHDEYMGFLQRYFARSVRCSETRSDLLSETFAAAWTSRREFYGSTSGEERMWVFCLARTQLTRHFRRQDAERRAHRRYPRDAVATLDPEFQRAEDRADMESSDGYVAALKGLSAAQQNAVELRIIAEWEYPQIACVLGVDQQVIRARVSRALNALRQMAR